MNQEVAFLAQLLLYSNLEHVDPDLVDITQKHRHQLVDNLRAQALLIHFLFYTPDDLKFDLDRISQTRVTERSNDTLPGSLYHSFPRDLSSFSVNMEIYTDFVLSERNYTP